MNLVKISQKTSGKRFLGLDFESPEESRGFARALRESQRVMVALLQRNRATICYIRAETDGRPTVTAQIEIEEPGRIAWGQIAGVICLASPFRWASQPTGIDRALTGQLRGVGRADLDEIFPVVASALARVPRGKDLN